MGIIPKYSLGCIAGLALIGAHQLLEGWAIATLGLLAKGGKP